MKNRPPVISLIIAALLGLAGVFLGLHLKQMKEKERREDAISYASRQGYEDVGRQLENLKTLIEKEIPEGWLLFNSGGGSHVGTKGFDYDYECLVNATTSDTPGPVSKADVEEVAARLARHPQVVDWQAQAAASKQIRKAQFSVVTEADGRLILKANFEASLDSKAF